MKYRYVWVTVLLSVLSPNVPAVGTDLSEDDVRFMKQLMAKDKLIRSLPKAQKGLAALNAIVSAVSSGPITIALQWNQAAIKTWRVANTSIDEIAKASICDEIDFRVATGGASTYFFEQLYQARGCPPE